MIIIGSTSMINDYIQKHSYWLACLFFLVFWFSFLIASGTLFSGYHFVDDHELIRIQQSLNNAHIGFVKYVTNLIANDIHQRFRPVYYIHRVIEVKLFGTNFFYWSLYTALLSVLTSFGLFVFGRMMGWSLVASLFFPLMTTLGSQSEIWWCLGPCESLGMFLLSLTLVFLILTVDAKGNHSLYETTFIILCILTSLTKESFILLVPAILFLKVWILRVRNKLDFMQALKAQALSISILLLIVILEIFLIEYYVGTDKIGYAGVSAFNLTQLFQNIKSWWSTGLFRDYAAILFVAVFFFIILSVLRFKLEFFTKNFKIEFISALIFVLLVIIPQLVLYLKSGFYPRYRLPALIGFSFFVIFLYDYASKTFRFGKLFFGAIVTFLLFSGFTTAIKSAEAFADDGKQTNDMFRYIESSTNADAIILVGADPAKNFEMGYSLKVYLNYMVKRSNLYVMMLQRSNIYNDFEKSLIVDFSKFYGSNILEDIGDRSNIACIILLPGLEDKFLESSKDWFVLANYSRINFGDFVFYAKKYE
jgi:hypothetical protein